MKHVWTLIQRQASHASIQSNIWYQCKPSIDGATTCTYLPHNHLQHLHQHEGSIIWLNIQPSSCKLIAPKMFYTWSFQLACMHHASPSCTDIKLPLSETSNSLSGWSASTWPSWSADANSPSPWSAWSAWFWPSAACCSFSYCSSTCLCCMERASPKLLA